MVYWPVVRVEVASRRARAAVRAVVRGRAPTAVELRAKMTTGKTRRHCQLPPDLVYDDLCCQTQTMHKVGLNKISADFVVFA